MQCCRKDTEKRRRFELALGVVLICALIVHHREKARGLLGEEGCLSLLRPDIT